MSEGNISRVVAVHSGLGEQICCARVIAYSDSPIYTLERTDGSRFSWRADLCRTIEPETEVAYWQARAERSERRLSEMQSTCEGEQAKQERGL